MKCPFGSLRLASMVAIFSILILCSSLAFAAPIVHTISQDNLPDTASEAAALLQLIAENPSQTQFKVVYNTPGEVTVFACDLPSQTLVRMHTYPTGRGSQEMWTGHVIDRLNAAVANGTLSDTPGGKKPGTHEVF